MRDHTNNDTELARVLRATFGRIPERERETLVQQAQNLAGQLGQIDISEEGRAPGLAYGGGPQTQKGGLKGKAAQTLDNFYARIFDGIDRSKCGVFAYPECLEVLSRMIEVTFRNFIQHVRLPSHQIPPFTARVIDAFPATFPVSVPGGPPPPPFVVVAGFTVPSGKFRGVITHLGLSAESATAFADLLWEVTKNGVGFDPYIAIPLQLWEMVPPTPLCNPIHLRARDVIQIRVQNVNLVDAHQVGARLCGWYYPVRNESGGQEIKATMVD